MNKRKDKIFENMTRYSFPVLEAKKRRKAGVE